MEEPYFPMQYISVPNAVNLIKNRPPKPPESSPTTAIVSPCPSLFAKGHFSTLPKIESSNPQSKDAFFSDLAIGLAPRSRRNNLVSNSVSCNHGMATIENTWQVPTNVEKEDLTFSSEDEGDNDDSVEGLYILLAE